MTPHAGLVNSGDKRPPGVPLRGFKISRLTIADEKLPWSHYGRVQSKPRATVGKRQPERGKDLPGSTAFMAPTTPTKTWIELPIGCKAAHGEEPGEAFSLDEFGHRGEITYMTRSDAAIS